MSKITMINYEKIFYHKDRLMSYFEKGDCIPIHATLGFVGYCNNNCVWCTVMDAAKKNSNNRESGEVNSKVLLRFLKEAHDAGLKAVTEAGSGDPLLHSEASYLINEIGKIGLDQGLFTNGTMPLDKKLLDSILDYMTFFRISLDAATPKRHLKLHKGPRNGFHRAIRSLQYLVKNRKGKFPTLGIQFVTSQYNIDQAVDAATMAKEMGLDYIAYKPMMKNPLKISQQKNILCLDDNLRRTFDKLRMLADNNFQVHAKVEQFQTALTRSMNDAIDYPVCLGHRFNMFLDFDGSLYLCALMSGRKEFILGNIYRSSFKEIWESQKRQKIIASINLANCPSACREHPLNKILYGLTMAKAKERIKQAGEPDPEIHYNFV